MPILFGFLYLLVSGVFTIGCMKIEDKDAQASSPGAPAQLQEALPQDLVVEGVIDNLSGAAMDWTRYRKIIFKEGAVVVTRGALLRIRAEQIDFTHATIRAFPEGAQAALGNNGRSGGRVEIQGKYLSGILLLNLSGEAGGDGISGRPYVGAAAAGQQGKAKYTLILGSSPIDPCSVELAPTEGARGLPGRVGGKSGDGGDTGVADIRYKESLHFQLQNLSQPGSPGTPGEGGPGQQGGLRGFWDGSDCGEKTYGSHLRERAYPGPDGLPGPAGKAGNKIQSCVFRDELSMGCF